MGPWSSPKNPSKPYSLEIYTGQQVGETGTKLRKNVVLEESGRNTQGRVTTEAPTREASLNKRQKGGTGSDTWWEEEE